MVPRGGSLLADLLRRFKPALHERYTVSVASGLIAGESLVLASAGVMTRKSFVLQDLHTIHTYAYTVGISHAHHQCHGVD